MGKIQFNEKYLNESNFLAIVHPQTRNSSSAMFHFAFDFDISDEEGQMLTQKIADNIGENQSVIQALSLGRDKFIVAIYGLCSYYEGVGTADVKILGLSSMKHKLSVVLTDEGFEKGISDFSEEVLQIYHNMKNAI